MFCRRILKSALNDIRARLFFIFDSNAFYFYTNETYESMDSHTLLLVVAIVGACIAGTVFVLQKQVFQYVDLYTLLVVSCFASLIIAPIVILTFRRRAWAQLTAIKHAGNMGKLAGWCLALGVAWALAGLCYAYSLSNVEPDLAYTIVVASSLAIVIGTILSNFVFKSKMPPLCWVGVVMVGAGVGMIGIFSKK
jgi:drug/metabolite transporter (DMT)-like permease